MGRTKYHTYLLLRRACMRIFLTPDIAGNHHRRSVLACGSSHLPVVCCDVWCAEATSKPVLHCTSIFIEGCGPHGTRPLLWGDYGGRRPRCHQALLLDAAAVAGAERPPAYSAACMSGSLWKRCHAITKPHTSITAAATGSARRQAARRGACSAQLRRHRAKQLRACP